MFKLKLNVSSKTVKSILEFKGLNLKGKTKMSKVMEKLKNDPLMPLRHSCEHVLHMAMEEIYPGLKRVMGPPIEGGFYFDFDYSESISPEDFPKIEARMLEIIEAGLEIKMRDSNLSEAREIFKENSYKLDILKEIEARNENITLCEIGKVGDKHHDLDLCVGGHTKNTKDIVAFKLLSVAGAYYKGDENNKMLQRIYGTAFFSLEELNKYISEIEKAKENDHRKVNQILDLFATSELVGKGLVMYTPNGTIVRNELRDYLLTVCKKHGAMEVVIPHMAKIDLYQKSGHAEKFKDELFKVISHYDEEFVLKPVNCPHHTQIYASKPRSYKDLPIAYVESTQQHRDEKPGAMVGLNRTRSFEIDDGHTFCTPDQIKDEVVKMVQIVEEFYKAFGMWGKHWVSLSFRDKKAPEKYIGDDEGWDTAEKMLLEVDNELNLGGKVMEGEAALYGPKIDIMLKDSLGNDRQLGTVQVDFAMPKRFGLTYTDADGQEKTPVMLHRAILGSYGRFIANLMESTGGAFPVWLQPTQVQVIPVSDKTLAYAKEIAQKVEEAGLRVSVNDKDETVGAKIRNAQIQKIPYMLIVGPKEQEKGQISLRLRDERDLGTFSIEETINSINKIKLTKSLELW